MTRAQRHHKVFLAEIDRRGGETGINHAPSQSCSASQTRWREVEIVDIGKSERRKIWLLRAEGWRYYSRRFGSRPAHVAYLAGYDDNGPWAVRVPGTCETADEALGWLIPAVVKRARVAGRRVLRQGDVYVIETTRQHDGAGVGHNWRSVVPQIGDPEAGPFGGHEWHSRARLLIHVDADRAHKPLSVPFPARFVSQRGYEMGRGGRQGAAD